MIKIIFMAKETLSSKKALEYLCNNSVNVEIIGAVIRKNDLELKKMCDKNHIRIFSGEELKVFYESEKIDVDYIFSFYWKKVKKDILEIPQKGSINFHPGPLPEARGSGYHVAILENWGYWGVTAHYMDEQFDTGAIIECRHFKIDDEIVNKDLVEVTHKYLFVLFKDIVNNIVKGEILIKEEQGEGRYFSVRNLEREKLICSNESVSEIDRKIRAFWNPPYNGAQIEIKGKRYTVINESILKWIAQKIEMSGK